MPDEEYRALLEAARRRGQPVSRVVRDSLRQSLVEVPEPDPDPRIATILRFARYSGPTGDIGQMLEEIERGRDLR
jgi:hypothetical protein